jgi:site-specific DNA-methyltransferase (adenine-specific)/adenine-specific DNA-methyltransferase
MDEFSRIPEILTKYEPGSQIVLYEGDTLNLLANLPSNLVRLIVTSPPYNLGKEYETRVGLRVYLDTQREIIKELVRVLFDNGSICWQVGNYIEKGEVFPLDIYYYDIFKDFGLFLRNRIIWHFGHGLHASKRFSGRYETILWFTKSDKYIFNLDNVRIPSKYPGKRHYKGPNIGKPSGNPSGKNPSDFWDQLNQEWEDGIIDIPNVKSNHPEKTIHPCQFPIELIERCVLSLTDPGDWILDPFAGVGSSLIAALKNNRKAIGAEKEPTYCAITRERIQRFFNGTLPIRPIGKPVYVPSGNEKVVKIPEEWKR